MSRLCVEKHPRAVAMTEQSFGERIRTCAWRARGRVTSDHFDMERRTYADAECSGVNPLVVSEGSRDRRSHSRWFWRSSQVSPGRPWS